MATVRDKGRNEAPIDKPYNSPNRTTASAPANSLACEYKGEIVAYNNTGVVTYWKATGVAGTTTWAQITPDGVTL